MAKITTISEPWDRHDYPEVEEFVKAKLKEYKDEAEELAYTEHPESMPLTFEAAENGVKIFFNCYDSEEATRTVEVSTDGGATWQSFTSEDYDGEENTPIATLNAGERALVRGDNEAMGYYSENEGEYMFAGAFRIDGRCYVHGNVMSLLDSQNFRTKNDVAECAFFSLFADFYDGRWMNVGLLFNPARRLVLPATTLAESCYGNMFSGCSSLASVPELPATTLAVNCYNNMFRGCTSLVNAPTLPATTLAGDCYSSMFQGCTSLVDAPALTATTLANNCYANMFYGCTSLVNAPALPATTLAVNCYRYMFYGCTSLVDAPALPATTLVQSCYHGMFQDCINLSYIKAMFTTMNTTNLTNWVKRVRATGTFVKNPSLTMIMYGDSGVPNNWDIEDAS